MDSFLSLPHDTPCVNDLPHSVQITLCLIANHCRKYGYCFAFNRTLAEKRKLSLAQIKRHIAILIEAGFLVCRHVGHDRRLYLNVPAESLQCATNEPLRITKATKGTKAKNTNVIQPGNLEEKTDKQEADTPTLPSESAVEKVYGRGDASETPGGLAEVDLLIEKRVEVVAGLKPAYANSAPQIKRLTPNRDFVCHLTEAEDTTPLPISTACCDRLAAFPQSTPHHLDNQTTGTLPAGQDTAVFPAILSSGGATHSIPQQDDTPAPTEVPNETTILRGEERDNAHHDNSRDYSGITRRAASQTERSTIHDSGSAPAIPGHSGRVGQNAGRAGKGRMDAGQSTDSALETLTAHGVDIAQAQRIASQHTQEAIARAIAYANQEEARKGRLTNKAGFIVSALSAGWHFKLLDVSPEGIKKRQERLRIRTEGATMVMGGVAPDMAYLRGRLSA